MANLQTLVARQSTLALFDGAGNSHSGGYGCFDGRSDVVLVFFQDLC